MVTRHLAVFPTGETRAVPPRLVSDRRPGPPGQGGAGQKSHSRENKFAPPGPGRGDSAVGRLRRQRPAPRHGPWGPQPHKGAQTSNPEGERGGASRRLPSLPRPSAPPPFAGATPDLPRPRGDRGATARAAPPPSPSRPEPPHLPRSGGLRSRSHRLRRPGSRRGAPWGLESSRGPLCASAAERGTTTPTMPCSHSRATPPHRRFHVTPDYISRQPSRLSRPPSGDTSRTGRQVGEPVGFPLAAAAAAPSAATLPPLQSRWSRELHRQLCSAVEPPAREYSARDATHRAPHHLQSGRPLPGPPSPYAAAGAPGPERPRGPAPAARPQHSRCRRPPP